MAWKRNPPDPFEDRRRKLAEQERRLSQERQKLHSQLVHDETAANGKRPEPPVWRLEDEMQATRRTEPSASRKRHLARQRRRDMMVFLICVIILLLVVIVVLWVANTHNLAAANGT